jgi:uncharacterized protein (TIGR03437 family)
MRTKADYPRFPPAKIAPGLVFTVKGSFPGPSTASTAQIDPNTGRLATNIEGVQVLVDGIACPAGLRFHYAD